jgi:phosphoadenosine phosphosulfate reductase
MNELRSIDRLDTAPRYTEHDAVRLNRMFRGSDTDEWLRAVIEDDLAGDLAIVSSFGAESAALLHLVSRIDHRIPVLFLETGKHFSETLAYRDELTERFSLNRIDLYPELEDLQSRDESGLRWSYDPDGCCELRKVKPLEKALVAFDASLTGRKAFQSSTRANLPRIEIDTSDAQGRLKINPLIDWDADRIAAYFEEHELPRHPLVERGYASIGCSPCTRETRPGEDPRAGRWAGWDKVECGIHQPGEEPFL